MPSQLPHFLVLFRCFWSSVAVQWIAWKDCLRNGPWNRTNSTQLDWLGARRLCTTLSAEEGNQPRVISLSLSLHMCVSGMSRDTSTPTHSQVNCSLSQELRPLQSLFISVIPEEDISNPKSIQLTPSTGQWDALTSWRHTDDDDVSAKPLQRP